MQEMLSQSTQGVSDPDNWRERARVTGPEAEQSTQAAQRAQETLGSIPLSALSDC